MGKWTWVTAIFSFFFGIIWLQIWVCINNGDQIIFWLKSLDIGKLNYCSLIFHIFWNIDSLAVFFYQANSSVLTIPNAIARLAISPIFNAIIQIETVDESKAPIILLLNRGSLVLWRLSRWKHICIICTLSYLLTRQIIQFCRIFIRIDHI